MPKEIILDPCDSALSTAYTWGISNSGYARNETNGATLLLHRLIAERIIGRSLIIGEEVDHINGNGLDNRRENIRVVPHMFNSQNLTKKRLNNTSGFRGVSFNKQTGKWRAQAQIASKYTYIGQYSSPEAAGEAARIWRLEHMPGALN